ncbi:MAG: TatD DNase family protein [Parcubacteria group bacterium]|nr:TatD DNase family protein [Parcubacteria group bacterium]
MKYFDAHCHVQFDPYNMDREDLLARMQEEQVGGLVVGVDLESSKKATALVEGREDLFASVGLHPNSADKEVFDMDVYRTLASNPKVVAIGECGLDNFRPADVEAAKAKQREVFEQHVQLSIETGKPLMIHSRPAKGTQDAYRDLIDILRSYKQENGDKLKGDIHFFVGGVEEARDLIALDFTLSFTAVLTFTHDYDEVLRFAPLTHILSETDAPYIAPASRRGQRNDSLAIPEIVAAIARIREEDEEMVRAQILTNATRVFGLPTA